jgi:hypothetical protein
MTPLRPQSGMRSSPIDKDDVLIRDAYDPPAICTRSVGAAYAPTSATRCRVDLPDRESPPETVWSCASCATTVSQMRQVQLAKKFPLNPRIRKGFAGAVSIIARPDSCVAEMDRVVPSASWSSCSATTDTRGGYRSAGRQRTRCGGSWQGQQQRVKDNWSRSRDGC